jgi:hypothetical protein
MGIIVGVATGLAGLFLIVRGLQWLARRDRDIGEMLDAVDEQIACQDHCTFGAAARPPAGMECAGGEADLAALRAAEIDALREELR